MTTYKIIKNKAGKLVNYGPDSESYQPIIETDQTLSIEPAEIAEPLISDFVAEQNAITQNNVSSAEAKLLALGLTPEDLNALGL